MKIRGYQDNDYIQLKTLITNYHSEMGESQESSDFYTKNKLKNFFVLVVEDNRELIAFMIGQRLNKNDYLLLDGYTVKLHRRKGIAIELTKRLLDKVKKYKRVLSNPNDKSKGLLAKFGFKELPTSEQNTSKKGKPPYYTYYLKQK